MIPVSRKYQSCLLSFFVATIWTVFLYAADLMLIEFPGMNKPLSNFVFWWALIAIIIHNKKHLKKKRRTVIGVLALIGMLIPTVAVDRWFNIPDNPVSLASVLAFWMGIIYLTLPRFFKQNKIYILGIYGIIFIYATYIRLDAVSYAEYENHEKGVVLALLIAPVPLLTLLYIYEQWKWLKMLKNEKAAAELALLKTQVNPHFFFNTLNNLYSLTVKQSEKAPEVILNLSEMMRYTIYEGKKDWVPLVDEVTYLQHYINLNQIRHHRKVDVSFQLDIDQEVMIAPLLFIIPLENAFKHGVDSLADNAYIQMSLGINESGIHFGISNNFDRLRTNEERGIGLENLKKRLELIYPDHHKLTIREYEDTYELMLEITCL